MLDQADIPYPETVLTWQEIWDLARRVKANTGMCGFDAVNSVYVLSDLVSMMGRVAGAGYLMEQGKIRLNMAEWEPIFAEVVKLYTDKIACPYLLTGRDLQSVSQNVATPYEFVKGSAAFALGLPGVIPLLEQNGIEWGAIPLPAQSVSLGIPEVFSIPADAPNPDASWAFIRFVTSREGISKLTLAMRDVPIYPGAADKSGVVRPDAFYQTQVAKVEGDIPSEVFWWFANSIRKSLGNTIVRKNEFDEAMNEIANLETEYPY